MASADHFSNSEIPFLRKLPVHQCPACEKLYLEAEEWTRKYQSAEQRAEGMKQMALAQETERDRLLRLLFSSSPEDT
jgi:hypothetical protein